MEYHTHTHTHTHSHVHTHTWLTFVFILHRMDLDRLPLDLVEILNKITPNEDEQKKFKQFTKDKKNPKSLPDNDRFLFEVCHCNAVKPH